MRRAFQRYLLVIFIIIPIASYGWQIRNATLAAVGKDRITLYDIQIDWVIERLQEENATGFEEYNPLILDKTIIDKLLSNKIIEMLILKDIERLHLFDKIQLENKFRAQLDRLLKRSTTDTFQRFRTILGFPNEKYRELLMRKFIVKEYLEIGIGMETVVSEAELKLYYDKHQDRFHSTPFEEIKPLINSLLHNEKIKKSMARILSQLKTNATITIYPLHDLPDPPNPKN